MSRFVAPHVSERIKVIMFGEEVADARKRFLQTEIARYIPQLVGRSEDEIAEFVQYQEQVYLKGLIPEIGRPIASLNPTFVDSVASIQLSTPLVYTYTRASVKENGYRMQVHRGVEGCQAFSRQFTRFDLRMFPELAETFAMLPLMVGDAELVNARHTHLAGFNRVQLRIPNQTYWPKPGEEKLDDNFIASYLSDESLFYRCISFADTELTLAFHGLFSIAHPKTWDQPREVQAKNMISLCRLPIDYKRIDEILDLLADYAKKNCLNMRVVERVQLRYPFELEDYVARNESLGYEGTCVVQSIWKDGKLQVGPKSVKIKAYETIDCTLLGLHLEKSGDGLVESNIKGALIGLYDEVLGVYLPVAKVNLDPEGVQIKTEGQKQRLNDLRSELLSLVAGRVKAGGKVHTLYDTFVMQGKIVMHYLSRDGTLEGVLFEDVLDNLPSRSDLIGLYEIFCAEKKDFCNGKAKLSTVPRKFINQHLDFFKAIDQLGKKDKRIFLQYFGAVRQIKATSAKLVQPQIVVDTSIPIILETKVFDIKWGISPFSAGFHSWYGNSFRFNNCFAERVRHDKGTTTDYMTVHSIARVNTPRKPRAPKALKES